VFPAQFQLVCAMNPCPCGWLGHASGRCTCAPEQVRRYRWRVSGALYDRIDMAIVVPSVTATEMSDVTKREASLAVRARIVDAHRRQIDRQGRPNARLSPTEVERHCPRSAAAEAVLARAMSKLALSARAYHRVIKVARTIADLEGVAGIEAPHIAEAIAYRRELAGA
jgi:magnesium chelatase family protein